MFSNALNVWKGNFVKSKKVWNQIKIWQVYYKIDIIIESQKGAKSLFNDGLLIKNQKGANTIDFVQR